MSPSDLHRLKAFLAAVAQEPGVPEVVEAELVVLDVPGAPQAKERPRVFRGMGVTPRATRQAEARIALEVRVQAGRVSYPEGGVALAAIFCVADRRVRDADNLEKLLLDACSKARLWRDDSQVVAKAVRVELDRERPRTVVAVCRCASSVRG